MPIPINPVVVVNKQYVFSCSSYIHCVFLLDVLGKTNPQHLETSLLGTTPVGVGNY